MKKRALFLALAIGQLPRPKKTEQILGWSLETLSLQ
jgi:hypothetical protein